MTYKELLDEIQCYINMPPKVPECFKDKNYIYCWCGKCKQDDYPLPEDFSYLIAFSAAEHYKLLKKGKGVRKIQ